MIRSSAVMVHPSLTTWLLLSVMDGLSIVTRKRPPEPQN